MVPTVKYSLNIQNIKDIFIKYNVPKKIVIKYNKYDQQLKE